MTDTSESTGTNTTSELKYGVGDTITIMRGIHRGKTAKVIGVDKRQRQYATNLTDGSFLVVNEVNTKPASEGSVGAGRLAALLKELPEDAGLGDVIDVLSTNVDGFAEAYDAE